MGDKKDVKEYDTCIKPSSVESECPPACHGGRFKEG